MGTTKNALNGYPFALPYYPKGLDYPAGNDTANAAYVPGLGEWPDFSGVGDYEDEDPEGVIATRTCTLYFQLPFSTGDGVYDKSNNTITSGIEWQGLPFDYEVLP
jgi:hypothetical protein